MLRPDAFVRRLADVSLDDLAARGTAGIIVDLDNTLVGYGRNVLSAADIAWIADAKGRGLRLCLLSNNFTGRVTRISDEAGIPAISSALKPLPRGFNAALAILGTERSRTVVIGDQLFTDVLGARLAGMHSILTEPIAPKDWLGTRILRLFERLLLGPARSR